MCILMCPVHIHQDTSRYTKIHQDTFVSISLAIMEMYLTLGYVSFFKIHLGYIQDTFQDTMYLNPQIHDTQDTLTIHVGYIGIHCYIRGYVSRALLAAALGCALGRLHSP